MLLELLNNDFIISGVATTQKSKFNSDHSDLSDIAIDNSIPYKYVQNINDSKVIDWIKTLNFDIIYCFGWSSLIGKKILKLKKLGVIGYHPTKLPDNRGRHPIIWSLVLGLNRTASTFFIMDENADSGDIISQKTVKINKNDNAKTLYNKLLKIAKKQVVELSNNLINNKINYIKQSHIKSNYWRKRSKIDGQISFISSSTYIYNLVRALDKPYVGAHVLFNDNEIKVWKCKIGPKKYINFEPGKVLDIKRNQILIKTVDGSIWFTKHEFKNLPKVNSYL